MTWQLIHGDATERLSELPAETVHCVVTSPPYFQLRDYGVPGQIGLEPTIDAYLERLVAVFAAVRRVLRPDGTLWVNMGDSYAAGKTGRADADRDIGGRGGNHLGSGNPGNGVARPVPPGLKPKDLMMMPARLALALQADGWYLRSDIIWHKPNRMPESVSDRPTTSHEHLFLLSKRATYYFDQEAVKEGTSDKTAWTYPQPDKAARAGITTNGTGLSTLRAYADGTRNIRTVWTIPTAPFPGAHFATFPTALVEPCILAGTSHRGACPACGAPWRRVVERTVSESRQKTYSGATLGAVPSHRGTIEGPGQFVGGKVETTGWSPGCVCDAGPPVPCVVLDCFSGAGTVPLVADRLGRHGIGIELSAAYCEMARRRLVEDAPLLALLGD